MVRTRRSAGVDMGVCTGGHWLGKNTRRCYRFTRAGKLKSNPAIRCTSGCFEKKCTNFDVCGVITKSSLKGDFCHLCTYLLACKKIQRPPASTSGECPVCLETHDQLYQFPTCNRHVACSVCMKRILFGPVPRCGTANYTEKVWDCISDDDRIITTKQECPICRAVDNRSFIEKFASMEHNGNRARDNEFAAAARSLILETMKAALHIAAADD